LDACAVIAFLTGEKGSDKVRTLLEYAAEGTSELHMHRINLLEVYYDTYKVGGREQADRILEQILNLPITIVDDLDDDLFRKSGELKATSRVSLADALALALAIKLDASLVSSDHHEFDVIQAAGLATFEWIR
jgi:predicted nucleic acid-binding protein